MKLLKSGVNNFSNNKFNGNIKCISDNLLFENKNKILDQIKQKDPFNKKIPLSPEYVTGFTDGEGTFYIHCSVQKQLKYKYQIVPTFQIKQSDRSPDILNEIKNFFGCGRINKGPTVQYLNGQSTNLIYTCNTISHLWENIIPHFKKYPLKTEKLNDFLIFMVICEKVFNKEHLTLNGLFECIDLSYSMNQQGKLRRRNRAELYNYINELNSGSINFLKDEGIV